MCACQRARACMCVYVCVRACVRVCVCARAHAFVHICLYVSVPVRGWDHTKGREINSDQRQTHGLTARPTNKAERQTGKPGWQTNRGNAPSPPVITSTTPDLWRPGPPPDALTLTHIHATSRDARHVRGRGTCPSQADEVVCSRRVCELPRLWTAARPAFRGCWKARFLARGARGLVLY